MEKLLIVLTSVLVQQMVVQAVQPGAVVFNTFDNSKVTIGRKIWPLEQEQGTVFEGTFRDSEGQTVNVIVKVEPHTERAIFLKLKKEKEIFVQLEKAGLKIPKIYDHFKANNEWFLVMERLHGSMAEMEKLNEIPNVKVGEPGTEDRRKIIFRMATYILNTLLILHQKLNKVHLDIKPDNILFDTAGNFYLMDYGSAEPDATNNENRIQNLTEDSLLGFVLGTPEFSSPGVHCGIFGRPEHDYWSLMYTIIKLVNGILPWKEDMGVLDMGKLKLSAMNPGGGTEICTGPLECLASCFAHINYKVEADVNYFLRALQTLPDNQLV